MDYQKSREKRLKLSGHMHDVDVDAMNGRDWHRGSKVEYILTKSENSM